MKYIISTNKEIRVDGFLTLDSVEDLKKEEDISQSDVIVIHSFSDKDFQAILELTAIVKNKHINQLFYINKDIKDNISAFVKSLNGVVENDETYLKDEIELNSLISIHKSELSVKSEPDDTELDILNDLAECLRQGNTKDFTKAFTDMIKRATERVFITKEQSDEDIKNLSNLLIDTYMISKQELDKVMAKNEEIKQLVNENLVETNSTLPKPNISHYPTVSFLKSFTTIVFKEYSACRYLTSFVMGFSDYLRKYNNLKVKTIILTQQNEGNKYRYPTSVEVTPENHSKSVTLTRNTVYTSSPSKKILFAQTDLNYDIVVILDRTYTEKEIIKNRVTTYHCVSGTQEIEKYKLNAVKCISTIRDIPEVLGTLKHINGLPSDRVNKVDTLNKAYHELYERVYKRTINK